MHIRSKKYTKDWTDSFYPFENIIHDVKIPLTIMYTKMQFLEETEDLSSEVVETLESIKKNWFRVMKLLSDVSDCSKINNGEMKPKYQNTDIVKLTEEITTATKSLAYRKNINLEYKNNISEKIVAIDREMIERIMLNLISNSIKFTNVGGKVLVELEVLERSFKIKICDNGNGIEKDKVESIFSRYVTESKIQNEKRVGSGLGLNIVKELVSIMDGILKVKSGSDGTEISIELESFLIEEKSSEKKYIDDFYSYNILNIELSDDYNI